MINERIEQYQKVFKGTRIKNKYKTIFLNPCAPGVFQDMAYDMSKVYKPCLIWTEVSEIIQFHSKDNLDVQKVPEWACYNRKNYLTRFLSTLCYLCYVFTKILFHSSQSVIFLVTTPPFLGFIGLLFKKLRRQKYIILVYDILPDALLAADLIKESFITKSWRWFNKLILNNSDAVITIGEYMAAKLEKNFDVSRTTLGHIKVIHNWADTELIKPLPKEQNPFVKEHGLVDKFIVMYSGNIGATHDMQTLVEAVIKLKEKKEIQFMIIGEGAKKQYLLDSKYKYSLDNMLIISYLPQDQLQFSLTAADISIVTISSGVEGCLVPSKFYSYLAAGNAVIAVSNPKCEIADIINNEQCGKVISVGDSDALAEAIVCYYENIDRLAKAKENSRNAAVNKYSRKNTQQYINVIEKIYPSIS